MSTGHASGARERVRRPAGPIAVSARFARGVRERALRRKGAIS